MGDLTQRSRVPKGTDAGGQFAASTNPEATVDLGSASANPYEGYEGPTVGELRAQLANLPDDEPALYWFRNRGYYDGDRDLTPEQWRAVADRFLAEIDRDSRMFEPLAESFMEVVDEIAPYDESAESFSRQMNRDDFADLYEPIPHPDRGSDDSLDEFYGGTFETTGTDLEFVKSQPSDHVWSTVIDDLGDEVLVNGIREDALSYYVTKQPFNDEYDLTVTR
jgi:hypothetical protein